MLARSGIQGYLEGVRHRAIRDVQLVKGFSLKYVSLRILCILTLAFIEHILVKFFPRILHLIRVIILFSLYSNLSDAGHIVVDLFPDLSLHLIRRDE